MVFERIVNRRLPNGTTRAVHPFHISMKGMESVVLCRNDDDYDTLQKYFHVCAWINNSLVISEIEMSNHGHLAILATDYLSACMVGEAIKKNYSQFFSFKYGERKTLLRADINVQYLDSDWYVRNALAYIPRNALDTGMRVEDYPWSSYRSVFNRIIPKGLPVASLTRREKEALFRTHADLKNVPWLIDSNGHLVPESACDAHYVECAFNQDQSFFLKTIGGMNVAELEQKLVIAPRKRMNDASFLVTVADMADRWFHRSVPELTLQQKTRILPHLYRSYRTSVAQLARCLKMDSETVCQVLRIRHRTGEE